MSQLENVEVKADDEFDADKVFAQAVEELAGQGSDLPGAKTDEATDPKADEHGQEDVPPAKDDASKPEPVDDTDIWATAPPALKAAYEAERERVKRLETTAQGHARSASQLGRKVAELEAKLPKGKGNEASAGETDEQREARYARLREEYGDSVGEILPELESLRAELAELKSVTAGVQYERSEADNIAQYRTLEERHPNWRQECASPEYVAWAESPDLPKKVREGIDENRLQLSDGATAAWVLDQFKRDTAASPEKEKLAERRQEQREAGRSADIRNPATVAKDEPTDIDGLWKAEMARRERKR